MTEARGFVTKFGSMMFGVDVPDATDKHLAPKTLESLWLEYSHSRDALGLESE